MATKLAVVPWPNGLGFDIGQAEIWQHKDGFRVFTYAECENDDKVLFVPYVVTRNPIVALGLTEQHGLVRSQLDEMDYRDAEAAYRAATPQQPHLFG